MYKGTNESDDLGVCFRCNHVSMFLAMMAGVFGDKEGTTVGVAFLPYTRSCFFLRGLGAEWAYLVTMVIIHK